MKLKYISWLPAIVIMITIYSFSSKTADVSGESSTAIADSIINVYENITDVPLQEEVRVEKIGVLDHIVRKTAHFTEYLILSLAFIFHFLVWKKSGWKLFVLSVGLSTLYAATDEYHQLFILGRSGQFRDVLIDASGAIVGFLMFYLLQNIRRDKAKQPT